jgi:peptidoglycan hydrolase-like protein with peptidoglycan-binding domain
LDEPLSINAWRKKMAILKKGLSGEPVRRLQTKVGVEADGEFGPNTEKALRDWQTKKGLAADGVAGPDTFMAMELHELVLLKQGTRGNAVKKLQEKLGVGADGQFGSGTEKAVREYQGKNGLTADGVAGPATLAHMKLFKEITPDTVKASQVSATDAAKGMVADAGAGLRSIWDTIKSVVSK